MKKLLMAILGTGLIYSSIANAAIIAQYDVANYNGGTAAHGLWTAGNYSDNTFSINAGTLFTIEDNAGVLSATLKGSASNSSLTADIDLILEDFAETFAYKQEGGAPYNPATDGPNDVDFFTKLSGTITIGTDVYNMRLCDDCGYAFQYGIGANAKNKTELGGSAWISNQNQKGTQHWDLNLSFTPVSVPEATPLALLGLGLIVLGFSRRQRG